MSKKKIKRKPLDEKTQRTVGFMLSYQAALKEGNEKLAKDIIKRAKKEGIKIKSAS